MPPVNRLAWAPPSFPTPRCLPPSFDTDTDRYYHTLPGSCRYEPDGAVGRHTRPYGIGAPKLFGVAWVR
jgi:hypothetical protein